MATAMENARTHSMRTRYRKQIENGVSLVSPLINAILVGLDRSAKKEHLFSNKWRNVEWGGASGIDYAWEIVKTRGTATVNTGTLATRSFDEPDLLDKATIDYYNFEKTVAISAHDKELNARDETMLDRIWRRRCMDAQFAIYKELADLPHNENATNQNAGLPRISYTEAADGSSTYAGIIMSQTAGTRDHWRPRHYDYGSALSIAGNLFQIVAYSKLLNTVSSDPGGGGPPLPPDFGVCDPTAWPYILAYYESNLTFNVSGGTHPTNLNMFEDGFANVLIDGITIFHDEGFGGATGSCEGGATDEIFFGHSNKFFIATSATKKQGFIRAITQVEEPWLSGDIGVYKTGMFCFGMLAPCYFGLAYT